MDDNKPDGQGGQPPEGGEEKLILGKFKSPDDLATAYSNLESEFTRKSQELSANKQLLESLQNRVPDAPPIEPPEDDDNIDDLFFREPAKATAKVIQQAVSPIFEFMYEQQKVALRSDPEFVKYEKEVDQLLNMQPQLKLKPGVVGEVFKMVKGMHFDPEEFTRMVLEKHKERQQEKGEGGLESPSASNLGGEKKDAPLSAEEKAVAEKFYSGMPKDEAHKKYAASKKRLG